MVNQERSFVKPDIDEGPFLEYDRRMTNEMLEKVRGDLAEFRLPRYKEITDVGLYLEQTVKLVNTALSPLGEPSLTTSMVSNYVKQKLLANPIKKQYYVDHIATVFIIAVLKMAVALDDIRPALEELQGRGDMRAAYDAFCSEFEGWLAAVFFGAAEPAGESELLSVMLPAVTRKIYLDRYLTAYKEMIPQSDIASKKNS